MSSATPTPQDAGLPPPATPYTSSPLAASSPSKPTILHLGDDIRWNHEMYAELAEKFNIIRTYSMGREDFKTALKERKWGDFAGMYRPFWNTGGEMGTWNSELMYTPPTQTPVFPHLTYTAISSLARAKSSPRPARVSTGSTHGPSPPTGQSTATRRLRAPSRSPTRPSCSS